MKPLINKIGGALSTGIVSLPLLISGINIDGDTVDMIDQTGKLIVKGAMFLLPLIFILVGYVIYRKKYKIDEAYYEKILSELENS